jgi:hypothetical protein
MQLRTIFFLLKFLPVPVNLNILFVRSDDFVLNLVCSFLFVFFLFFSAFVLSVVNVVLNTSNRLICLLSYLNQSSYRINLILTYLWLNRSWYHRILVPLPSQHYWISQGLAFQFYSFFSSYLNYNQHQHIILKFYKDYYTNSNTKNSLRM